MKNEAILNKLKKINDPELGKNIVDLGLIYEVNAKENSVKILMTFTTPFCPYGQTLMDEVKTELKKMKFKKIDVELTFDPPWSLEKINPEIRHEFMPPIDV